MEHLLIKKGFTVFRAYAQWPKILCMGSHHEQSTQGRTNTHDARAKKPRSVFATINIYHLFCVLSDPLSWPMPIHESGTEIMQETLLVYCMKNSNWISVSWNKGFAAQMFLAIQIMPVTKIQRLIVCNVQSLLNASSYSKQIWASQLVMNAFLTRWQLTNFSFMNRCKLIWSGQIACPIGTVFSMVRTVC